MALGFVKYTRGLGRKRIAILNDSEEISASMMTTPLKKQCSREIKFDDSEERSCSMMTTPLKNQNQCSREIEFDDSEISLLECLPQDILVRVLCGVNHEDLKQLFHVSKSIREATSLAKQHHFAYSTPTKTRVFPKSIDFENTSYLDEIETPNAPKQWRFNRPRISDKKLADISVSLFATADEDHRPKNGLIFDTQV